MIELYILILLLFWLANVMQALNVMVKKGIEPSFWSILFVILPIVNTYITIRYFRVDTSGFCGFRDFWKKLNDTDEDSNSDRVVEQKPADKVEPVDQYEGLTDFERILADICIGWIGEEPGWKQYIKYNADVLLEIAVKMFNSVQDAPFEQKPTELANGEDYGIDGLWTALDILQKTYGKVEGYQTDDGILEHKCAISAVKELYEQKPTEEYNITGIGSKHAQGKLGEMTKNLKSALSEEDEAILDALIRKIEGEDIYVSNHLAVKCLKSIKDRYTWKPNNGQMKQLGWIAKQNKDNMIGKELISLYQDLKKLIGE